MTEPSLDLFSQRFSSELSSKNTKIKTALKSHLVPNFKS
jgi:hypothetical protein